MQVHYGTVAARLSVLAVLTVLAWMCARAIDTAAATAAR
jgi:hypothetical protein